jgi:hypothetical protein
MRRILRDLIAAVFGGVVFAVAMIWLAKVSGLTFSTAEAMWKMGLVLAGIEFVTIMLSTSVVGLFVKEEKTIKVEVGNDINKTTGGKQNE